MITKSDNVFVLSTKNTTYAFAALESGHLEHLYYGRKIESVLPRSLFEKHAFVPGTTNQYSPDFQKASLEDMNLEISSLGKGDIREPFVEILHADGSFTCDFLFQKAEISEGKQEMKTLPGSYGTEPHEEEGYAEPVGGIPERLCITLSDDQYGLLLELDYYVYAWCDVITRCARLINVSDETVRIKRLMSGQLDFDRAGYTLSTFTGAWGREMNRSDIPLQAGKYVNSSLTGCSSNRANPFVMLHPFGTTEDTGDVWGMNLIYSGNHAEVAEVTAHGKTRVVWGMNPECFLWELPSGRMFEAPEAVMSFSHQGFNGMSHHFHDFILEHIVRGKWKKKERPILLNSWEAAYFDINEAKLLKLAKAAKQAGIELFVMDDGWFGERNDDTTSLGDWTENRKKLPGGVKGLCEKINALGLEFGIWVEPEMVNVKSRLYEAHPEWVLQIPGKPHSEGRNQRILDLGREDVQKYVVRSMAKLFASANISYVKWDMNRTMTDVFSQALPAERQGEVYHRYMMGLYRCLRVLMKKFPDILFEGCASGGNRFDLGMLCFFPQIWGSDNTDAVCRAAIQTGYSYGYPLQCVSAHVSGAPNHQTLRTTPLASRFAVAMFGSFGYELNLCDLGSEEKEAVRKQVELYKENRKLFTHGHFYRGRSFGGGSFAREDAGSGMQYGNSFDSGNVTEWTFVSADGKQAVGMLMQKLMTPNCQYQYFIPKGLLEDTLYHFGGQTIKHNIKEFGDLVNTVSPVHIKQDSLLHDLIARFYKMNGESEDYFAYGDSLMYAGVKLSPAFGGTGYDEQVRLFGDFASRIYFINAVELP